MGQIAKLFGPAFGPVQIFGPHFRQNTIKSMSYMRVQKHIELVAVVVAHFSGRGIVVERLG